jgi:hypothetical protein
VVVDIVVVDIVVVDIVVVDIVVVNTMWFVNNEVIYTLIPQPHCHAGSICTLLINHPDYDSKRLNQD